MLKQEQCYDTGLRFDLEYQRQVQVAVLLGRRQNGSAGAVEHPSQGRHTVLFQEGSERRRNRRSVALKFRDERGLALVAVSQVVSVGLEAGIVAGRAVGVAESPEHLDRWPYRYLSPLVSSRCSINRRNGAITSAGCSD